METLLIGQPGVERMRLAEILTEAGATVRACHDDAWGCVALHEGCPLDIGPIEVAVLVAEPGIAFDPHGVACARRARVPVVTIGGLGGDAVCELADAHLDSIDERTYPTLERIGRTVAGHRSAVEAAAREFLHDGEAISVEIERRGSTMKAAVSGEFATKRSATIGDQVRAAIRRHDASLEVIDVTVRRG